MASENDLQNRVLKVGRLFITENILGFQSLDLGLKFSLICHTLPSLSLPAINPLLKFLESKEILAKAKQKFQTLQRPRVWSMVK